MKSTALFKIMYVVLFLITYQSYSQEKVFKGDPDKAFEVARNLAFNKQRKAAQDTLLLILTKYPTYNDVRSFLGSTYSWDGAYDKAAKEFEQVLTNDPTNKTTWIAAINNQIWADKPYAAIELADKALTNFPNSNELLLLKANAQENTNKPEEAFNTLELILKNDPNNQKALDFKSKLATSLSYNKIGIKSAVDLYSSVFDPMQYHTLSYSRQTKLGSVIAKVNFNRRFNSNGLQFETDLYPKITKGLYAYLNIGFANSFLFPDLRYGGELYKSLPHSFEISAGFRALKYSTTTTIYTGSIGWYTGNSYWSVRPYFTPGDSGTSTSGTLTYRKYRSTEDTYFSAAVGIGFSPEFNQFIVNGNENAIVKLKSQKVNVGYNFISKNKNNLYGLQAAVTHQEISFDVGNYFWIYSLSFSYNLKFR